MSDWKQQLEEIVAPAVARSRHVDEIVVDRGALARTAEVFGRNFADAKKAYLVADENTFGVAGGEVEDRLTAAGVSVETLILPAAPRPKPTRELAEEIRQTWQAAAPQAVPVAVGSGVVNDLVKYGAFFESRPYLCVATAASMDGYASSGSPLVDQGFKQTIECVPPRAIVADLDIIVDAPAEMTGWGFGDLAGKVPAGADWMLADALGIESIDDVAWPLVQTPLRGWLAQAGGLKTGDAAATAGLFAGLTVTGLAMEFYRSSRPASGADHQIAHIWEMENHHHRGERVSHGACVALGCMTVLAYFDWLLERDLSQLDIEAALAARPHPEVTRSAVRRVFPDTAVAAKALAETEAKTLTPAAHAERLKQIVVLWPALRPRLQQQVMPAEEMRALLIAAGAPTRATDIGITGDHLRATVERARFLRRRYTVLDLLADTGLLESATEAVFADGKLH